MCEQVYYRLREFLDKLPGGFPATESGVEIKLLKKYFTPEEAELVMQLRPVPEPLPAIAERLGMSEEETREKLEYLARQGNIFRLWLNDQPHYMAMQFLVGIYEFHVKAMDRELAELLEEYLPHLARYWADIEVKQQRIVPVATAVDTCTSVATYDVVRELVKAQDTIAVAECICRKEKRLLGKGCEHPLENCLTFNLAAQYYIENGIGRKISLEECLAILDQAEEQALVLAPTNSQDISNICCCCGDSCNMLRGLKLFERPADHALSSFQACIDAQICSACGTCLDRCQMEAIWEKEDYMEVDLDRCIGCGLCIPTCPEDAVRLTAKPGAKEPPANFVEMQMKIAAERGLQ